LGIQSGAGFAGWIGGSGATDNMVFSSSGGAERMRINESGNLGIGITAPGARLNVNDASGANTYPLLVSNSIAGTLIASAGIRFSAHGIIFAEIVGGQQVDNDYAIGNLRFFTRNSEIVTERMRITGAGNVGIGTTAPSATLSVNGSITYLSDIVLGNGLNPIFTATYNNNSLQSMGLIHSSFCIIGIQQAGLGNVIIPVFGNGGGGIAWSGTMLDPDTGTWAYGGGPSVSFTTAGSPGPNSYTFSMTGGGGVATIQRTSGSAAFTVTIYRIIGNV
jgi:hypothetical protein